MMLFNPGASSADMALATVLRMYERMLPDAVLFPTLDRVDQVVRVRDNAVALACHAKRRRVDMSCAYIIAKVAYDAGVLLDRAEASWVHTAMHSELALFETAA